MKISTRTILKNILDNTVSEWEVRIPDQKFPNYENWKADLLDKIEFQLQKRNLTLDEIIVDTVGKETQVTEAQPNKEA